MISYSYDGLQRLTGAVESPGVSYSYTYDLAGNRTDGGKTYNAANQITNAGYTYDAAGNLTNDGTASYAYDALSRMTARGATTYTYNGDGALVYDGAFFYTQDLAAPLSHILQLSDGRLVLNEVYGHEHLASLSGSTGAWYNADALSSVRQTLDDAGVPMGHANYDPWGGIETSTVGMFGFTGELHDVHAGMVNLRARWYSTARGTFTSYRWRISESNGEIPYSHHPYAYALSNPVLLNDPTGKYAVNEDGLRESRTCPPGTYADPRTGRCWGSGSGGGGNWGDEDILGMSGVVAAVQTTEYVLAQTANKLPTFCEVPILVLTRDQVAEWNRSADEAYQQLGQGQNQPEAQPQPQPVTSQPTPPVPSPSPRHLNRATVQIQGRDLTKNQQKDGAVPDTQNDGWMFSFSWAQYDPISAKIGRQRLAELWTKLTPEQQHRRSKAYYAVVAWIDASVSHSPPGRRPPEHFAYQNPRSDLDPFWDARVDVAVYEGVAFDIPY